MESFSSVYGTYLAQQHAYQPKYDDVYQERNPYVNSTPSGKLSPALRAAILGGLHKNNFAVRPVQSVQRDCRKLYTIVEKTRTANGKEIEYERAIVEGWAVSYGLVSELVGPILRNFTLCLNCHIVMASNQEKCTFNHFIQDLEIAMVSEFFG